MVEKCLIKGYRNSLVKDIRNKIVFISVFLFLGTVMSVGIAQYVSYRDGAELLYDESYAEHQVTVKNMVSTVLTLVDAIQKFSRVDFSGTEKKEVLSEVEKLPFFNSNESLFIASFDGTILFDNSLKETGNSCRYTLSEVYGDNIFEGIRRVINDHDVTGISCLKGNPDDSFPGVVYVGKVPGWKWIIGGEAWENGADDAADVLRQKDIRHFIIFGELYMIFAAVFFAAVFAGFRKVLKYAEADTSFIVRSFNTAVNLSTPMEVSKLRYKEFRLIAEKINRVIQVKKNSEEKAVSSDLRYKRLFANMQDSIIITDSAHTILDANQPSLYNQFGYGIDDVIGKSFEFLFKDKSEYDKLTGEAVYKNTESGFNIVDYKRKDNRIFTAEVMSFMYKSATSKSKKIVFINRDITQRIKNERNLKKLLEEKQILLREVHHRVKNNMAVIIAFLSLQSMKVEDAETKEILESVENRIRTMILVHEFLHQDDNLRSVKVKEYIDALVFGLLQMYGSSIEFHLDVLDTEFGIDVLVPLGLLINEILTNSFRHAFISGLVVNPQISVGLTEPEKGSFILSIRDNGSGMPQGYDLQKDNPTIGIEVIHALVQQLGGSINIKGTEGTEYIISFTV